MLYVLKEFTPFVALGSLHFMTVANMLNLGKEFLAFSSLTTVKLSMRKRPYSDPFQRLTTLQRNP